MKLASLLVLLAAAFASAQNQNPPSIDVAVRAVLQAQVGAWNHHDLDAFMAGYWKSPELTFFSGATETKGWEPTLERYRRNYQSAGNSMGTLSFSDLRVEPLSSDAAFVRGQFHLVMPDGKQPHGVFTLIFRKFPEGWRIVHDHTCAAAAEPTQTSSPPSPPTSK
jgi:ketosteroid isomerase-like protein